MPFVLRPSMRGECQALNSFLATYEAEHGVITKDEIDEAVRRARSRATVVRPALHQVSSRGGMTMLLDAGAFVAVDRGDRDVVALVKRRAVGPTLAPQPWRHRRRDLARGLGSSVRGGTLAPRG